MNSDIHNCLNTQGDLIADTGHLGEQAFDNKTITKIAACIELRVKSCQKGKRLSLTKQLEEMFQHRKGKRNRKRVSDLSSPPLSAGENNAVQKRADFKLEEVSTKEHLVELEQAFKSSGFPKDMTKHCAL